MIFMQMVSLPCRDMFVDCIGTSETTWGISVDNFYDSTKNYTVAYLGHGDKTNYSANPPGRNTNQLVIPPGRISYSARAD